MAKVPPPAPSKTRPRTKRPAVIETVPHQIQGLDIYLERRTGAAGPNVPKIDPAYVFRPDLVEEISYSAFPPEGARPLPSLFVGPKGCGKTSLILQVAARLNIPVYRINLNVGTTTRHLKGHRGALPGRTVHYEGIAIRAMEEGAWLVLDELSGATPPVALALFPLLEHDGEVLLEDAEPPRYARRHPAFRVFATDNTIGAGAEESRFSYSGTNPDVNEALLDRFGGVVEVGYLDPASEHKAVKAIVPEIPDIVLEGMIRAFGGLRKSSIDFGFSTRMVVSWAQRLVFSGRRASGALIDVQDPKALYRVVPSARIAFLNSMRSSLDRDAAQEVLLRFFPTSPGAPK